MILRARQLSPSPARPSARASSAGRHAGFTLVELLIALAIVGALLTVAFGGLRVALGAWRQGENRTEAHQHARGMALIIARAVSAAYPYRAALGVAPEQALLFSGDETRLAFVTQWAPYPLAVPVAFVGVVTEFEPTEGLVVRQRALPNRDPFTDAEVVLRDPTVTAVGFRYLDEGGGWQSRWENDRALPRGIEITIETAMNNRYERLPPITVSLKFPPA